MYICCVIEDMKGILPRKILVFCTFLAPATTVTFACVVKCHRDKEVWGPGGRRQGAGHRGPGEKAASRVQGAMSRATVHYQDSIDLLI